MPLANDINAVNLRNAAYVLERRCRTFVRDFDRKQNGLNTLTDAGQTPTQQQEEGVYDTLDITEISTFATLVATIFNSANQEPDVDPNQ